MPSQGGVYPNIDDFSQEDVKLWPQARFTDFAAPDDASVRVDVGSISPGQILP